MKIYVDHIRRVWLSYEYLKDFGISIKTINHWKERNIGKRIYIDCRAFIDYDTIPEPTRKLLPNKACLRLDSKLYNREKRQEELFNELNEAYNSIAVAKWSNEDSRKGCTCLRSVRKHKVYSGYTYHRRQLPFT